MIKFSIISTKGGVGKTTLTANLAALLADLGLRVLMIDADVQPSLSKFFPISNSEHSSGLTDVIVCGEINTKCICSTVYGNLDIVLSDDPQGNLPHWLLTRIDRGVRLRIALQAPAVANAYDCVLIDTQGAVGPLQDAAALAADVLISPITPEILSAREFRDGTLELLNRLSPSAALGAPLPPIKAVIYRQDRTNDARMIAAALRDDLSTLPARVSVLNTVVPHAKAYKEAATLRVPVHRHERHRLGPMLSAAATMHQLVWELIPDLHGKSAEGFLAREDIR
jgi:chromosome partitioning related protein ParA